MLKKFLICVVCFLICVICVYAQETLTITTYYPSPYGVYKTLRIYPNDDTNPSAACSNAGEMYYDNSDKQLYICNGSNWISTGGGALDCVDSSVTVSGNNYTLTCPSGYTKAVGGGCGVGMGCYASRFSASANGYSCIRHIVDPAHAFDDVDLWCGSMTVNVVCCR